MYMAMRNGREGTIGNKINWLHLYEETRTRKQYSGQYIHLVETMGVFQEIINLSGVRAIIWH